MPGSNVESLSYATPQRTPRPVSPAALWTGRVLSVLFALPLLAGGVTNLVRPPSVVEETVKMGYSRDVMLPLGVVLLVCTVLYLIPRTAVLGAILLTGWLGGAVSTHVRAGDPLLSKVLMPVYFGVALWLALFLRDARLRALVPWRTTPPAAE